MNEAKGRGQKAPHIMMENTMTRLIRASVAMVVAALACGAARADAAQTDTPIRMGDTALTCEQIVAEANLSVAVLGAPPAGGSIVAEQAVGAATGLAMQSAILSGSARSVPGLGMAGGLLGSALRASREQQAARQAAQRDVARQRWHYLNGLYAGRACGQPASASTANAVAKG